LPIGSHTEGQELADALEVCGAAALIMASEEGLTIQRRRGSVIRHDCDFLKLTSGTTNTPRAVRFRAHQLVADCTNICETMGITSDDLNFGVVPFSHSYGFSNLLTPLLCRGVPLVASEDRMPRAMLSHLECTGATVFPGMPVFFDKLAALENITPLSDLRLCISAGAPLPSLVAKTFFHRFDQKIHTFYGSSECGGIGYDASSEPRFECGFAGQPLKGVEITPEPGEGAQRIVVRGPAVADGYFPSADEETLGGGRFIPGDLIRWSECGMFIEGRASDIINIAGRKLNPAEIEGRISAFPGVRQVVVFGVPSALRGEEPIACVAGEGLDRTALQRFCQMQLSQWQIPRDFWIVPEIPANERGKISRRALAEDYASRME
jgi:acyl-CoA synthetase (AMP-forming)/AMP-acid ligase II